MATRNITSSGDWDALTAAASAVNGDTININVAGGTVTINQSPTFLPNLINVTKGILNINGAGGTSPINIGLISYISPYEGGNIVCSEGMWCVGTTAGTPSQVINFSDYMFKTTTGGSRRTDVAHRVNGLWIESGLKIGFTGGTSIQFPEANDWIYQYNVCGTNFGRIANIGTAAGDKTQGTIDLQYWIGSIIDPMKMEVRKVIDREGPLLERIWEGTTGGAVTLAKGVFNKYGNVGGYISGFGDYEGLATHGTALLMHMFTQGFVSTTGTFHNLRYPLAGGTILAPKVNIYAAAVSDINAYRTGAPSNSNVIEAGGQDIGNATMRGCNYANYYSTINRFMENFVQSRCSMMTYRTSYISGTDAMTDCIMSPAWQSTSVPLYIDTAGAEVRVDDCLMICSRSSTSPIYHVFTKAGLNISNSIVLKASTINSYASNKAIDVGIYNTLGVDNCILDGNIYGYSGGTSSLTNTFCRKEKDSYGAFYEMYNQGVLTDLYMSNIQLISHSANSDPLRILYAASKQLGSITMRACYNPKFTDTSIDYIAYLSYVYIDSIDIARCYLSPNKQVPGLSTPAACESLSLTDVCLGGSSGISMGANLYKDVTLKHVYHGLNYNKTVTISGLNYNHGNAWHDQRFSGTEGMISWENCYDNPTDSSENKTEVTLGTDGYIVKPQAGYIDAGGTFVSEMPFFCKGISRLNGTVSHTNDNYRDASYRGKYDWSGTCYTDFQYDTGGTGFNGNWMDLRTPPNLKGLSIDPSIGVKLKIRLRAPNLSNRIVEAKNIQIHYEIPVGLDYPVLYPIDQVMTVITLRNVVVGSRYYIYNSTQASPLTSGVASATTVTYSVNSTSAANGDTLTIKVRKSSASPKYKPFETSAIVAGNVTDTWVSQEADSIASS